MINSIQSNKKPKVSVIITTHNRINLLQRAIKSVKEQTYSNLEIIVIDDKSTDGTHEYCENLEGIIYRYIPKDESKGGNYARNQGILMAKGEYIAFLDDDDYWLPAKIEKQVELIEKFDCELVHCGRKLEIIYPNEIEFKDCYPNPNHWGDMKRKILLTNCTATSSCILVKRRALIDIGLFDENLRFWQDYELTIRLAQRKPFYFINELLCVYRIDKRDNNRLTNKYYPWLIAVRYIHQKHRNLYNQLNIFEKISVKKAVWLSGKSRSKASGEKKEFIKYWLLLLPIEAIRPIINLLNRKS